MRRRLPITMRQLSDLSAAHYPGDLCELVQASLDESADNAVYATFTPTSWSTLANLPPPERRKLLVHFKDRPVVMWLLV